MKAKVSLHAQGPAGWFKEFLELSGASHIKGVDFYPDHSSVTTIGRPYYPQDLVDDRIRKGAAGADAMFEAIQAEVEANPQVGIWETPANEPSIWDPTVAAGFIEFTQRMIFRFHLKHCKVIVGSINTGWPRLPSEDGGAMMRLLAQACQGADGLSFHEYDPVDMRTGGGYTCLRYRHFHEWCLRSGWLHPPIYITECGLDRTDPPGPDFGHAGWKIILDNNVAAMVDQAMWYESELQKDDYVVCAAFFTATPSGWWSFDMHREVSMMLAQRLHNSQPAPPVYPYPPITEMAQGFFASEYQGVLDFDAIRDAGYDYVHIRASSGLWADELFDRNWLKAGQAGLLRSVWHLVSPDQDGQAKFFKGLVGDRVPEMGIWADFENVKDWPPLTREKADAFLSAADRNFGQVCNVYSSPGWLNSRGGYATWEAQGRELWLAHWTSTSGPLLPDGASHWTLWQWKCRDSFGPFSKRVCLDRFAGTQEDLYDKYGEPTPPPPKEGDMWFKDNDGNIITEEKFRWALNPATGDMDSFGYGYEVVPRESAEWVVDGMQTQLQGPPLQWVRVMKTHSAVQPPDLGWGFPDPVLPDEELLVAFKDKGSFWEAEHDCSNRYYPDRPEGEHGSQGPYFCYIDGDMVQGYGFVAGTGYKTAIIYMKPSGAVEPEPPEPDGDVDLYDAAGKLINEMRFRELMGDAFIKPIEDLREGEEYLKIVELWIREVKRPRFARLLVRRPAPYGDGLEGVPFKFFGTRGQDGVVFKEGLTNASGTGELELGSQHAYAVPGSGEMNLRIKKNDALRADQMRDYGMVRVHGALNRHCDVIYELTVWGEVEPEPPVPPLPGDITEALEQLHDDHLELVASHNEIHAKFDTQNAAIAEFAAQLNLHLAEIERLLRKIAGE